MKQPKTYRETCALVRRAAEAQPFWSSLPGWVFDVECPEVHTLRVKELHQLALRDLAMFGEAIYHTASQTFIPPDEVEIQEAPFIHEPVGLKWDSPHGVRDISREARRVVLQSHPYDTRGTPMVSIREAMLVVNGAHLRLWDLSSVQPPQAQRWVCQGGLEGLGVRDYPYLCKDSSEVRRGDIMLSLRKATLSPLEVCEVREEEKGFVFTLNGGEIRAANKTGDARLDSVPCVVPPDYDLTPFQHLKEKQR